MSVAARVETCLQIALEDVRRESDDRSGIASLAEFTSCSTTIQNRHLHVHQDDVERGAVAFRSKRIIHRLTAIFGCDNSGPASFKNSRDEQSTVRSIFGEKDPGIQLDIRVGNRQAAIGDRGHYVRFSNEPNALQRSGADRCGERAAFTLNAANG